MSISRAIAQVVPPDADHPVHRLAFTGTSTGATETGIEDEVGTADTCMYSFCPTEDCHIEWGDSGVGAAAVATSMFYPGKVPFDKQLSRSLHTHIRVIQNSTSGSLYWHKSEK